MFKKLSRFLLLSWLIPGFAFAQVQCTDKPECWPEGSAMRTAMLLSDKLNAAELALASKHEELVEIVSSSSANGSTVDSRLLEALKNQQAAWLTYRSEECELIGSLTGAGGFWPSTWALDCKLNRTKFRLLRISSAISCIKKISVNMRVVEQNECLYQLAPLTEKN